MSRRWFRHADRQIFVGWDKSLQSFFLSIAELCRHCNGYGEEPDSDNFCSVCGGDGIQLGFENPSGYNPTPSLDEMGPELERLGIPFPEQVRRDLELDQLTNAGEVLQEYTLETGRP